MNLNTGSLLNLNASPAGTYNSLDLPNGEWSKGSFLLNLSAKTGTPSITITISGEDAVSGVYYPLLTSDAITVTGAYSFQIAPGLTNTNRTADAVLPTTYQISAVITGSGTFTGTIGGSLLL